MSRRLRFAAVASALLVAVGAAPAAAADLEDYLDTAQDAEYSGRRIVVTLYEGESAVGIYTVAQAGDVTVIAEGGREAMVGDGKVTGNAGGVVLPEWSTGSLAARYETSESMTTSIRGREAHLVTVIEDDNLRAKITFDDQTGAVLATEIYDGNGRLFRQSAMLDFDPSPVLVYSEMSGAGYEYDVVATADDASLPAEVAGYARADAYRGPDDSTHSFYADGLFSFSVFEVPGRASLSRFEGAASIEVDGRAYPLLIEPTEVWTSWHAGDVTYLLVGDLPPDHLREVLDELPAPSRPGLLKRLWRGLFG